MIVVDAGATAQTLGSAGAKGDYLSHVVFQPSVVGAGTSYVYDGDVEMFRYTAGTLADLRPITFAAGDVSKNGAWKVTTGANMRATAVGRFS